MLSGRSSFFLRLFLLLSSFLPSVCLSLCLCLLLSAVCPSVCPPIAFSAPLSLLFSPFSKLPSYISLTFPSIHLFLPHSLCLSHSPNDWYYKLQCSLTQHHNISQNDFKSYCYSGIMLMYDIKSTLCCITKLCNCQ